MADAVEVFLSKQTTVADTDRFPIRVFRPEGVAADDRTVGRSPASVATAPSGAPLATGAAGAAVPFTADTTATGKEFMPALVARRWMLFENLSNDIEVEWVFGTSVTVGEAFRLGPRGRVMLSGDLPNDPIRVITATGSANLVGQQR